MSVLFLDSNKSLLRGSATLGSGMLHEVEGWDNKRVLTNV